MTVRTFDPPLTPERYPDANLGAEPILVVTHGETVPGIYGVPTGWVCVAIAELPRAEFERPTGERAVLEALAPVSGTRWCGLWSHSGAFTYDHNMVAVAAYVRLPLEDKTP